MQVAKTLIAHLDWGLPVQQAIAAPNIYFGGEAVVVEANTPLADMATDLARFGRTVVTNGRLPSKANAAERGENGWIAAGDPRSDGVGLSE
ncbi:MAG TPA: gamma-glutamyltransferase, partial [Chakrabartia sp.]|nr:gamma-glutamyltransferase [Chakrabartia sp.]